MTHPSISLDSAAQALSYVSPTDRLTRVRMGEALLDEFGDDAFDAFDAWYAQHDRHTPAESKQAWKSFGKGGGKCTIATLIFEARRNGFKFNASHAVKRTPEEQAQADAAKIERRAALAAEAAAEAAAAAKRALAVWMASQVDPVGHAYLARKGIEAHGARRAKEWVKTWTSPTGEVVTFRHKDPLIVPMWSTPGKLASLQAIFPVKCIGRAPKDGEQDTRRDKDYLTGGVKQGAYFLFGRAAGATVLLVCEGFATGASLHEATGHPVMAAFDAGNLEPVAVMARSKLPDVRILVCADNDQFLPKPKGNPGVAAATKAAEACKGEVVVPQFADLDGQPTDFNDLHLREGLAAVTTAIAHTLNPPAPTPAPPPPEPATIEKPEELPVDEDLPENNRHFTILGYNHDNYFVFQHGKKQISTLGKGDMAEKGLIALAELNWWEMHFPGGKGAAIDTSRAANFIMRVAEKRGIYDPSRIRGRGAWVDADRMVFHHGGYLSVDNVETDITAIRSRYVYELNRSLPNPDPTPMSSDDGEEILAMCEQFRWTKPGSAALLAGWIALAPMCGALRWRPHIWLTGGAGCGKSTILNDFVHRLLGGLDLYAQGNSSEAGIRQTLRADAIPVLFDESESNEETDARRVQNVLSLIRQASTESEAQTYKGTAGGDAMAFHIRSMFCLASIQVAIKHQADVERLAVLALRPKREDTDAGASWDRLKAGLYRIKRDVTLPGRLFRRSLDLLPLTLKNIDVFTAAAGKVFNNQRDGDQYGTLLAGTWSLLSSRIATEAEALALINKYDWSEHRESNDMDEGQRALSTLMEAHIRVAGGDMTVYELVSAACGRATDATHLTPEKADAFLQRHGMLAKMGPTRLLLSNTSTELKKLVAGTPFEADLRGMLLRVEGATRNDGKPQRFSGVLSKCITIPLDPILEGRSTSNPF